MRRGLLQIIDSGAVDLGLISYWSFDDDFTDQVGTNDGTPTTGISRIAGQVNDCLENDGDFNRIVEVSDSNSLSFGNGTTDSPFSICFWVNFNTLTLPDSWFFSKRNTSVREYQFYYFSGFLTIQLTSNNNNTNRKRTEYSWTPTLSTWYNIIMTYDGSGQPKLFIDNVEVGSASNNGTYVAMTNTISNVGISGAIFANTLAFDGKMDEVAIAGKEWNATERTYIYNQGVAGLNLI